MAQFSLQNCVEERAQKEYIQQKHYYYFNELQTMARDLPQNYQQRLPYELLSSLANSLLDGTVFDIVRGLKEIQQMTEINLMKKRMAVVNSHKEIKLQLQKKHKEALAADIHNAPLLQIKYEKKKEEMEKWQEDQEMRAHMKIIMELDQAVSDQQVTLEKAGVPGFFVTNSPNEIRLQMYLLEFIYILYNSETETT